MKCYPQVFQGILFAIADSTPRVVDVPLHEGVDVIRNLSDLNVNYWVNQRERGPFIAFRSHLRKSMHVVPSSLTELQCIFTCFFESSATSPEQNMLMERVNSQHDKFVQVYGNILVIKSSRSDRNIVQNMCEKDLSLVTFFLKVCVFTFHCFCYRLSCSSVLQNGSLQG